MATERQIEANRLNAQRSTGPRSAEGKSVSRLNALKTGIDAQSLVIRDEDPDALAELTREYHQRFHPVTPEQRFLVDELVKADWILRRLGKVEAELWEYTIKDAWTKEKKYPLGQAFHRGANDFTRLQRRMDSLQRHYRRSLDELRRLQAESASIQVGQASQPVAPESELPSNQQPFPEIGFVPSPHAEATDNVPPAS